MSDPPYVHACRWPISSRALRSTRRRWRPTQPFSHRQLGLLESSLRPSEEQHVNEKEQLPRPADSSAMKKAGGRNEADSEEARATKSVGPQANKESPAVVVEEPMKSTGRKTTNNAEKGAERPAKKIKRQDFANKANSNSVKTRGKRKTLGVLQEHHQTSDELGPDVCPVCKRDASKACHRCKVCGKLMHAICGDATVDKDGHVEEGFWAPRLCSYSECQTKGERFKFKGTLPLTDDGGVL